MFRILQIFAGLLGFGYFIYGMLISDKAVDFMLSLALSLICISLLLLSFGSKVSRKIVSFLTISSYLILLCVLVKLFWDYWG